MSTNQIFSHPSAPELQHQNIAPGATYSPWYADTDFMRCYLAIRQNTLVDLYRCYELWSVAKQMSKVEGCFLEVGVWRGGTGALLAFAATTSQPQRKVYLADTFQGVVKAGENDPDYVGGEHADTSIDIVKTLLGSMGMSNVSCYGGDYSGRCCRAGGRDDRVIARRCRRLSVVEGDRRLGAAKTECRRCHCV